MKNPATEIRRNKNFKLIVLAAVFTLLIWLIGLHINVYKYIVIGAVFELIWLPIIICTFSIPLITFFFWMKDGFRFKSKFLNLLLFYLTAVFLVLNFS